MDGGRLISEDGHISNTSNKLGSARSHIRRANIEGDEKSKRRRRGRDFLHELPGNNDDVGLVGRNGSSERYVGGWIGCVIDMRKI